MRPELRERREKTWEMLAIEGRHAREVAERLADAYGVSEETVLEDIDNMVEWLPDLDYAADEWVFPESRLRELRTVRQRLHAMAKEAQDAGDLRMELDIHREIIRTLGLDEDLADELDRDGTVRRLDEMLKNDQFFR